MLYACDSCRYLFESEKEIEQCPDCGKFSVRLAERREIEEYESRGDVWEDEES